jgi:hypothetical protein
LFLGRWLRANNPEGGEKAYAPFAGPAGTEGFEGGGGGTRTRLRTRAHLHRVGEGERERENIYIFFFLKRN